MFSAECQAEKRDLATGMPLSYEFEDKMLNERFPWNAWKQTENRNKTLQEDRNSVPPWDVKRAHWYLTA
jgi:hypothetical protein